MFWWFKSCFSDSKLLLLRVSNQTAKTLIKVSLKDQYQAPFFTLSIYTIYFPAEHLNVHFLWWSFMIFYFITNQPALSRLQSAFTSQFDLKLFLNSKKTKMCEFPKNMNLWCSKWGYNRQSTALWMLRNLVRQQIVLNLSQKLKLGWILVLEQSSFFSFQNKKKHYTIPLTAHFDGQ